MFNMLNVKYFILGQVGQEKVQQNSGALGNGWFVSSVQSANSANEEIDAIENLNPATTAIIHEDFNLSSTTYSGSGTINLTSYHPDKLTYESNNSGNGLAVFSEVWYGANGWKAYIDGKETPILRANYVLRALEIPAGKHSIEFVFKPTSYYTGEIISLISSILIFLLLIGAVVYRNKFTVEDD
jgi:hypothetical protein